MGNNLIDKPALIILSFNFSYRPEEQGVMRNNQLTLLQNGFIYYGFIDIEA